MCLMLSLALQNTWTESSTEFLVLSLNLIIFYRHTILLILLSILSMYAFYDDDDDDGSVYLGAFRIF